MLPKAILFSLRVCEIVYGPKLTPVQRIIHGEYNKSVGNAL